MWLENHCNPARLALTVLCCVVLCHIIESETLKFCLFTHISSFWLLRTFHVPIISLTLHSRHVSRRTASTVKKVESQRGEFVRDIHDHEWCQFAVHEMSPSPLLFCPKLDGREIQIPCVGEKCGMSIGSATCCSPSHCYKIQHLERVKLRFPSLFFSLKSLMKHYSSRTDTKSMSENEQEKVRVNISYICVMPIGA